MSQKNHAAAGQVAERAYSIWEKNGRPEGRDLEHWLRAEFEVAAEARAGKRPQPRKAGAAKAVQPTASKTRKPTARKTSSKPKTTRPRARPRGPSSSA